MRVINNSMIARGKPLVSLGATSAVMDEYRRDFANCDQNLDQLADALIARPHARLCLHGPPGTGKTAFVRSLADASDAPLVQKKTSDLLSAWLGDTEANIARMFHEAQRQQAILLLDEADSFLQDRRGARHSWEITQVNELLVQMENFDGLFFCCTNLMENLDEASLRRFDIKVRFDFLKPDQVWLLFRAHLEHARRPIPCGKHAVFIRQQLSTLSLTPGDYAVIARRMHVLGRAITPELLLDELRIESSYKPGFKKHSVGFV
ncbi:MAG: ATP-binding protein [Gammaproteobacteria bacterium]